MTLPYDTHSQQRGTARKVLRYYGFYSNKSRGMRKKEDEDNKVPALVETDISKKRFRKNWARLIQKIYHVDSLRCTKCNGHMRIISFIEDEGIIKKILKHLNLWMPQNHDPPNDEKEDFTIHIQSHRSFEWWEAVNSTSTQDNNYEGNYQMPYEDEYSQLTPYED